MNFAFLFLPCSVFYYMKIHKIGNFCNFVTLPTKRTKTIFYNDFHHKCKKRVKVTRITKDFVYFERISCLAHFLFSTSFSIGIKVVKKTGFQVISKNVSSPTRLKAKLLTHDADNVVLLVFQLTCQNLRKLQRSNREHSFQSLKMNFHAKNQSCQFLKIQGKF